MNIKLNTICFILLLFLLCGVVSASDCDNETLQTIDDPICEKLEVNVSDTIVSKCVENESILTATAKNTLSSTNKLKVNLKADNVKMYYNDGSKFKVTLKDNKKKVMKNAKIKITVNGKTYAKATDSKGIASFNLNLNAGTYKVLTTYDGSAKYQKKSITNTVVVKSTISAKDLTKYYKNKGIYSAKFYDRNGKTLKKSTIKYSILNNVKKIATDKKGVVKINVDLKPGRYQIALGNLKTGEVIYKIITIKSPIEHNTYTMDKNGNASYSVKIFNANGKAYPNQKVTFNVDNKVYNIKSDKNGIATLHVKLTEGKHKFITTYDGISIPYEITVTRDMVKPEETPVKVRQTNFTHTTLIPNYVNVTTDYVFSDTSYAIKTGFNGIIKMPKKDLITIQVGDNAYLFSNYYMVGVDTTVIGYKNHLVPFDGSPIQSEFRKENLNKDGIIISSSGEYTSIEFKSTNELNTDLFSMYMSKGLENSETITYIQNNKIKAIVNFFTDSYDESGLRYNLAKFYQKSVYDFNYKSYADMTNNNENSIKYVKTNESVAFSYFGNYIVGSPSQEDLITKFHVNGREELEKAEKISYGRSEDYVNSAGFEVLQSYAIINEKVTDNVILNWLNKNTSYLSKTSIANAYSMFMNALETAWLADKASNDYAKDLNVTWVRGSTVTILGGLNLKDTYIHILNADMGMTVTGNNSIVFKAIVGLDLPTIEDYVLTAISEAYDENSTNSLYDVLNAFSDNKFSIAQLGDIFYIFSEKGDNSTIIINSTSGVVEVLMLDDNFAYKGAKVTTRCDCCSIVAAAQYGINSILSTYNTLKRYASHGVNYLMNKGFPLGIIGYQVSSAILGLAGGLATGGSLMASATFLSVVGPMFGAQSVGIQIREHLVDKNNWYEVYDKFPITRNGPIQYKKCFNIPKSDGTTDYIEVKVKDDGTLDRNDAIYISSTGTKKLSKNETYKYFSEEKWVTWNIPKKYQKYKVPF